MMIQVKARARKMAITMELKRLVNNLRKKLSGAAVLFV
jgi:hypothetical protein